MLSHVFLGTDDLARAEAFYAPILSRLGWRPRFSDMAAGKIGWAPGQTPRPLFLIGRPHDQAPAVPANGGMVALLAPDRPTVDEIHACALRAGGRCEGGPGLRPHYHAHYYGAYFRDLDGNKLCVCCHDDPGATSAGTPA